ASFGHALQYGEEAPLAFSSDASDLVPGDTNGTTDVFVETPHGLRLVSVAEDGTQGQAESLFPTVSGDGRFVAFLHRAYKFGASGGNANSSIYVKDMETGTLTRIDRGSDLFTYAFGTALEPPRIDATGDYVAFVHSAGLNVGSQTTRYQPTDTGSGNRVYGR